MTSLNALTLRINASTEGVSKAVRAVRGDVNRINRIMGQTASATDKAREAQQSLARVYRTGAIDAQEYSRGLEAIRKKYGQAATSASKYERVTAKVKSVVSGTVGQFAAYAAGVASVGLAFSQITQSFAAIDQLAKTSDRLGIATDKLASLRFAAEETGVSANTLDMALQRMVRRVAEAAQGSGEAQAALKQLNLDARELAKLSPDEQFKAVSEAMAGVNDQSERVRLAFKLFDSEGVSLVNTLKIGRDGLNQYEQAARELGIAIDRDMAARVEKANDAFGRVRLAISGVVSEIAIGLAPVLTSLSNILTPVVRATGTWSVGIAAVSAATAALIIVSAKVVNAIRDIIAGIKAWRNAQITLMALSGPKGWLTIAVGIGVASRAVYELNQRVDTTIETTQQATIDAQKLGNAYQQANEKAQRDAGRKTTNERVQKELQRLRERNRMLEIGEEAYRQEQLVKDGITKTEAYNLRILRERNAELEKQKQLEEQARQSRLDELRKQRSQVVANMKAAQQMPNQRPTIRVEIPPSITRGSREEYQRLVETQNKQQKSRIEQIVLMKQQKLAQERAARAAELGTAALERIDQEIANLQGGTPV